MPERYESKYGVDYDKLPDEPLRGALYRYIEHRVPTGGFMRAVLSNDLCESFARADYVNRHRLFEIVQWIYCEAPSICWGSPEAVDKWVRGVDKE